jgi:hypothetical protein
MSADMIEELANKIFCGTEDEIRSFIIQNIPEKNQADVMSFAKKCKRSTENIVLNDLDFEKIECIIRMSEM